MTAGAATGATPLSRKPNQNRLHSSLQNVPPIEYETEYYRQINARQQPLPGELSLH
jgi:hypothetical protein